MPQQVRRAAAFKMNNKKITNLKLHGKTNDEIYELAICGWSLFGKAFFGFKASRAEKQKMNRLWNRILDNKTKPGVPGATISPQGSGKNQ